MLGRRKTIFLGSSIMVVGATLQCSAFGLPQFIVGRLVTGYVHLASQPQPPLANEKKRRTGIHSNAAI